MDNNKRRTMREKIEQMYIQALIDYLPPNVFADQVLRLFNVVGRSEQLRAFVDWWHGLSEEELAWYEGRYVEVFLSL